MGRTNSPRERLESRRNRVRESDELNDREKEMILEMSAGLEEDDLTVTSPVGTKADSTNSNYVSRIRRLAEGYSGDFTEITESELKQLLGDFDSGQNPKAQKGGYAKGTMVQFQSAAKAFVTHHSLDIDPDNIPVSNTQAGSPSVDERDMLDNDDIQAMRDVIENPRDECLFELLLNTGQRVRAIQTLRIKDVDVQEGVYWLNTDEQGLKGADKVGKKRPLLGAVGAVKKWLEFHPTGKREDYLITATVNNNKATPGEMLSATTMRTRLKQIADRAEVDKPVNPHNFRHSFVTMCKRDYHMDDSTIKFLIGHSSDSTVMETTYQHLTDEDHIKNAEVARGHREPEEPQTVGRTQCPNPDCLNELDPTDKACSSCGTVVSPDAKAAQDTIQQSVKREYRDTSPEDKEKQEKIEQLDSLLEDPDVKAALLEKLGEE